MVGMPTILTLVSGGLLHSMHMLDNGAHAHQSPTVVTEHCRSSPA